MFFIIFSNIFCFHNNDKNIVVFIYDINYIYIYIQVVGAYRHFQNSAVRDKLNIFVRILEFIRILNNIDIYTQNAKCIKILNDKTKLITVID